MVNGAQGEGSSRRGGMETAGGHHPERDGTPSGDVEEKSDRCGTVVTGCLENMQWSEGSGKEVSSLSCWQFHSVPVALLATAGHRRPPPANAGHHQSLAHLYPAHRIHLFTNIIEFLHFVRDLKTQQ